MTKRLKLRLIVAALALTGCATHSKVTEVSPQAPQDEPFTQCLDALVKLTPPPKDALDVALTKLDHDERLDLINLLDDAVERGGYINYSAIERLDRLLRNQLIDETRNQTK